MSQQIAIKSATEKQPSLDRTTAIGIGATALAIVVLAILIGAITLLPAKTISDSIDGQEHEQQIQLINSLAVNMQASFTNLTSDMLSLADRPEIQTADAEQLIADTGTRMQGQVRTIALFKDDGTVYYKWPSSKLLDWDTNPAWAGRFIKEGGFQYQRLPEMPNTYLLIKPVTFATVNSGIVNINTSGLLAFELDLTDYFKQNFDTLKVSDTTEFWAFDSAIGADPLKLYGYKNADFTGAANAIRNVTDTKALTNYPTQDRESVIATVNTPFRSNNQPLTFTLVLSRTIGEGQQSVVGILQRLFLVGITIIALLVIAGVILARYLMGESRRRRQDDQRRSTARALLEMARALNSSLDLNIVLQRILGELGAILPHDSASIFLLNEDKKSVTLAAETGGDVPTGAADTTLILPLNNLRGAREVINTGRPAVINDCATDPRWRSNPSSESVRAWLGVPLRVRDEAVGVLNINSHIVNRFLPDDIDFAEAFADQAGVAIQNARAHELEIKVYETELDTARAIQNSLLPQEAPPVPQLEIAAYNIAARHVSGDYYQYFPLPDGKLGVAIGDVSGKGIPAALLMAVVTTTLRDEILTNQSPSTLLNELNARLLPRMKQNNMNSALLMTLFDPATRHVEIANAGMVQPYVRNGKGWDSVPVGGYPLGASARMSYNSKVVTLAPDSILLLISDGVIESQNIKGEFFGFEGLEALLAEMPLQISAQQLVETILSAVRTHLEGQEPQDDITVVVMKSVDTQ